jgi:YjbE family integral membrane protein
VTAVLTSLADPQFLARLWTIVLIDIMLAGDNALVIALAVRALPRRQQVLGRVFGTAGAVVLRILLITLATALLGLPFLQLLGGLLLIWIAVKLVRSPGASETHAREATSLRSAIWTIVVADTVMSLDNVIGVAGAAGGDLSLIVFGIALSIPIVVWGSGLLARLMTRFAWIVWVGGGVLGYVAGDMILADRALARWSGGVPLLDHLVPAILGSIVFVLGWWHARTPRAALVMEDARPADRVEVEVKCRRRECGALYDLPLEPRPVGCYFPPVRCDVCGRFSLTILVIKVNERQAHARAVREGATR